MVARQTTASGGSESRPLNDSLPLTSKVGRQLPSLQVLAVSPPLQSPGDWALHVSSSGAWSCALVVFLAAFFWNLANFSATFSFFLLLSSSSSAFFLARASSAAFFLFFSASCARFSSTASTLNISCATCCARSDCRSISSLVRTRSSSSLIFSTICLANVNKIPTLAFCTTEHQCRLSGWQSTRSMAIRNPSITGIPETSSCCRVSAFNWVMFLL
mmetsp:Transcript_25990/g.58751  ORF Transcript_25990/g.58751 Transcript_25990/m.58751 type:complete len:216 (+) Transcript_25990:535-1182(+)